MAGVDVLVRSVRVALAGEARARDRKEVEDAAAVVLDQHDGERELQAAGGDQAPDVVGERDIPDQQHHRLLAGRGGAEGGGDRAVDPVRAAVAQHARRPVANRPEALQVTHRHRGGHEQRRLRRQQHAELQGDTRLGQPLAGELAEDRLAMPMRSAARQRSPQSSLCPHACGHRPGESRQRGGGVQRQHRVQLPRRDPARRPRGPAPPAARRARPASQPRSGFDTGRSPTRRTRSGTAPEVKL